MVRRDHQESLEGRSRVEWIIRGTSIGNGGWAGRIRDRK
jgi:hypothetical protein